MNTSCRELNSDRCCFMVFFKSFAISNWMLHKWVLIVSVGGFAILVLAPLATNNSHRRIGGIPGTDYF